MHLDKSAQRKRLEKLERDPLTRWRVTKRQWKHWGMYEAFVAAAERIMQRTSTGDAPWTIVEGLDERYRSVTVATIIRDAIRRRLAEPTASARPRGVASPNERSVVRATVLARLDMSTKIDR